MLRFEQKKLCKTNLLKYLYLCYSKPKKNSKYILSFPIEMEVFNKINLEDFF